MSTTTTMTVEEPPRFEFYYRDSNTDSKRKVLVGDEAVETFDKIPVVNVSRISSENVEERKAVAKEIANVCENIGFMYIEGHGVAQELVDRAFKASQEFHAQPSEVKMKEYIYNDDEFLRGFDEIHTKTPNGLVVSKGSFLFSYEPDNDPTQPKLSEAERALCLGLYNKWPKNNLKFKDTMLEYQRELLKLARKLMRSFALALGVEENYFDDVVTAPFISILLQHYHPTGEDWEEKDSFGAHTDYETFTILAQDPVGGLEVLNKNGIYVPAPYIPGTFVVNIGDFLERVSNDKFVSTVHRVRNTSGVERYSIPFFFSFNMDANVGVLPNCTSPENPAKYQARNLAEYCYNKRRIQIERHNQPGLDKALA
ncbi:hypothetical protein BX600DRAFT_515862 [Xylariales sp. PMI_506]|nr:hypothetical protein BX600DRAFT_515862 [Xylariales sp. PMI_506]